MSGGDRCLFLCHLEDETRIRTDSGRTSVLSGSFQLQPADTRVNTYLTCWSWNVHGARGQRAENQAHTVADLLSMYTRLHLLHRTGFACRRADMLTIAGLSSGPTEKPASKAIERKYLHVWCVEVVHLDSDEA